MHVERLVEQLVHSHRHTIFFIKEKIRNRENELFYTIFNNSGPLTDMKLMPDSLAIAFANKVLPENGKRQLRMVGKRNFKTNRIQADQRVIHRVSEQIQNDRTKLDDESMPIRIVPIFNNRCNQ